MSGGTACPSGGRDIARKAHSNTSWGADALPLSDRIRPGSGRDQGRCRRAGVASAGPWLCQTRLPLDETIYVGNIYVWLATVIPDAFVAALNRMATEGYRPWDPGVHPLRAFLRRPQDARIDWRAPVQQVLALVRGTDVPSTAPSAFWNAMKPSASSGEPLRSRIRLPRRARTALLVRRRPSRDRCRRRLGPDRGLRLGGQRRGRDLRSLRHHLV